MAVNDDKPVCLVLHGCRQGIRDDKGRLDIERYAKKLFKKLSKTYRVKVLQARHPLSDQEQGRQWYAKPLHIQDIPLGIPFEDDYMQTIHELHETIERSDPQGRGVLLVGFSQGANVIDTYLAHQPEPALVTAAILFSGYGFVSSERRDVDVPTIYVGHPDDSIVPFPDGSEPYCSWMNSYDDIRVLEHDTRCKNNHGIPTRATLLDEIIKHISP